MPEPLQILVVCTMNICRSPAAAALLRRQLAGTDLIEVTSAGVDAVKGSGACELATELLGEPGEGADPVPRSPHAARRVAAPLLDRADLVLALDRSHRSTLAQLAPAGRPKTFTLRHAARLSEAVRSVLAHGELPEGAPPLPDRPGDRLRWFVAELDAARAVGFHPSELDPTGAEGNWHADDVPDPHVLGFHLHPLAIAQIRQAADSIGAGIADVLAAPPGLTPRQA